MQPTTLGGSTPIPVGTLFTPGIGMARSVPRLHFMGLDDTNAT